MKGEFLGRERNYDAAIDLYQHVNGPPASPEHIQQLEAQALRLVQDRPTVITRSCGYDVHDVRYPNAAWSLTATTREAAANNTVHSFVSFVLQHSNYYDPLLSVAFDTTNNPIELRYGTSNSLKERHETHFALQDMLEKGEQLNIRDKALLQQLQDYVWHFGSNRHESSTARTHPAETARTIVSTHAIYGTREQQYRTTLADGRHLSVMQSQKLYYLEDIREPLQDLAWTKVSLWGDDEPEVLFYTNHEGGAEIVPFDTDKDYVMNDQDQEEIMQQAKDVLYPRHPRTYQIDTLSAALHKASEQPQPSV